MENFEQQLADWYGRERAKTINDRRHYGSERDFLVAMEEIDQARQALLKSGRDIRTACRDLEQFREKQGGGDDADGMGNDAKETIEFLHFVSDLLHESENRILIIKAAGNISAEASRISTTLGFPIKSRLALRRPKFIHSQMVTTITRAVQNVSREMNVGVKSVGQFINAIPNNYATMTQAERVTALIRSLDRTSLERVGRFSTAFSCVDYGLVAVTVMLMAWNVVDAAERDRARTAAREAVVFAVSYAATTGSIIALSSAFGPEGPAAVIAIYLVGMILGVIAGQGAGWVFDLVFGNAPPAMSQSLSAHLSSPLTADLSARLTTELTQVLSR